MGRAVTNLNRISLTDAISIIWTDRLNIRRGLFG